jgi:hypothetical protein
MEYHSEEIAAQIRPLLHRVKTGGPQFWGCATGRPGDGYYQLVAFEVEQDLLRLHFEDGETRAVWSPRDLQVDGQKFQIAHADRVRWEWFYPSQPKAPPSLYFMEFVRSAEGIVAATNIDYYDPNFSPDPSAEAVMWWGVVTEPFGGTTARAAASSNSPATAPQIPRPKSDLVQRMESNREYASGLEAARRELASRNKAGAIRLVRDTSGVSLAEAQELVAYWVEAR